MFFNTRKKVGPAFDIEVLHTIVTQCEDAVIIADSNLVTTYLNPAAEEITGWAAEDAAGELLPDVLDLVDAATDATTKEILKTCRDSKPVKDLLLIAKDSSEYRVAVKTTPVVKEDHETSNTIIYIRKIEESSHCLQSVPDELQPLLCSVSHDFNNIITAFYGNITLAKFKTSSDHPAYVFLNRMEESNDRIQRTRDTLQTIFNKFCCSDKMDSM